MPFSDGVIDELLDHAVGGGDYTRVNTLYFGLSTADPTGDGSANAEPGAGSGYARIGLPNSADLFPAASSGVKRNASEVAFAEATSSWGTITHATLWTDATSTGAGAFFAYGALGSSKAVAIGDTPRFQANSFGFSMT